MADKTVPVYNLQDGLTGRDGGPYLDQVERYEAERFRAIAENREPNYSNLSATAGTPLVTAGQLIHTQGVNFAPSQGAVNTNPQLVVDGFVNNEETLVEQAGEAVVNSKAPTPAPTSYETSKDPESAYPAEAKGQRDSTDDETDSVDEEDYTV